jgi:hypothetical protein
MINNRVIHPDFPQKGMLRPLINLQQKKAARAGIDSLSNGGIMGKSTIVLTGKNICPPMIVHKVKPY